VRALSFRTTEHFSLPAVSIAKHDCGTRRQAAKWEH
jgi:hypothetical protein